MRKLADARIEHLAKAARLAIDEQATETLAALYAAGLESSAARSFLAAIPDPATLMPLLDVTELEAGTS